MKVRLTMLLLAAIGNQSASAQLMQPVALQFGAMGGMVAASCGLFMIALVAQDGAHATKSKKKRAQGIFTASGLKEAIEVKPETKPNTDTGITYDAPQQDGSEAPPSYVPGAAATSMTYSAPPQCMSAGAAGTASYAPQQCMSVGAAATSMTYSAPQHGAPAGAASYAPQQCMSKAPAGTATNTNLRTNLGEPEAPQTTSTRPHSSPVLKITTTMSAAYPPTQTSRLYPPSFSPGAPPASHAPQQGTSAGAAPASTTYSAPTSQDASNSRPRCICNPSCQGKCSTGLLPTDMLVPANETASLKSSLSSTGFSTDHLRRTSRTSVTSQGQSSNHASDITKTITHPRTSVQSADDFNSIVNKAHTSLHEILESTPASDAIHTFTVTLSKALTALNDVEEINTAANVIEKSYSEVLQKSLDALINSKLELEHQLLSCKEEDTDNLNNELKHVESQIDNLDNKLKETTEIFLILRNELYKHYENLGSMVNLEFLRLHLLRPAVLFNKPTGLSNLLASPKINKLRTKIKDALNSHSIVKIRELHSELHAASLNAEKDAAVQAQQKTASLFESFFQEAQCLPYPCVTAITQENSETLKSYFDISNPQGVKNLQELIGTFAKGQLEDKSFEQTLAALGTILSEITKYRDQLIAETKGNDFALSVMRASLENSAQQKPVSYDQSSISDLQTRLVKQEAEYTSLVEALAKFTTSKIEEKDIKAMYTALSSNVSNEDISFNIFDNALGSSRAQAEKSIEEQLCKPSLYRSNTFDSFCHLREYAINIALKAQAVTSTDKNSTPPPRIIERQQELRSIIMDSTFYASAISTTSFSGAAIGIPAELATSKEERKNAIENAEQLLRTIYNNRASQGAEPDLNHSKLSQSNESDLNNIELSAEKQSDLNNIEFSSEKQSDLNPDFNSFICAIIEYIGLHRARLGWEGISSTTSAS